jgi:hypothetical protein
MVMHGCVRVVFGLVTALALLAFPAVALGAYEAAPADGAGSAIATGTTIFGGAYSATLTTSFSPIHIQPGQPFTYTGRIEALSHGDAFGPGCTSGASTTTTPYDSWFFSRVGPGEDYPTEGSSGQATVSASFTNTEVNETICPDSTHFTSGPMTVPVSGEQTAAMEPGCYQSTVFEAGIYFPSAPADAPSFSSLSGTLGTLRVGDGLDCAKAGAGAAPTETKITFDDSGVGSVELACERLAGACEGKATLEVKKEHGRVAYPHCKKCKVARGPYKVAAGSAATAELSLTPAGIQLLGRGRHCGKQAAKDRTPYPSCKKCKVARLVLTDGATHAKTTTRVRFGNCRHCG